MKRNVKISAQIHQQKYIIYFINISMGFLDHGPHHFREVLINLRKRFSTDKYNSESNTQVTVQESIMRLYGGI